MVRYLINTLTLHNVVGDSVVFFYNDVWLLKVHDKSITFFLVMQNFRFFYIDWFQARLCRPYINT